MEGASLHGHAEGKMEGPLLPEGSGGEEPPEELPDHTLRAAEAYNSRMWLFEQMLSSHNWRKRRRKGRNVYETKNCEEAWGDRNGSSSEAEHRLGRYADRK